MWAADLKVGMEHFRRKSHDKPPGPRGEEIRRKSHGEMVIVVLQMDLSLKAWKPDSRSDISNVHET